MKFRTLFYALALGALSLFSACDSPKKSAENYARAVNNATSGEELRPFACKVDLNYLKEVYSVYMSFDSTKYRQRIHNTMIPKTEFSWFYAAHQEEIRDTTAFINLALDQLLKAEKTIFSNAHFVEANTIDPRIVKVSYAYKLSGNYSKLIELVMVDNDEDSWKLMMYERFRRLEAKNGWLINKLKGGPNSYFESVIEEVIKK